MKDINTIVKQIIKILNLNMLSSIILDQTKESYHNGIEEIEKRFNSNFMPLNNNLNIFQEYTFDNIKGMNTEIAEKLRKSLVEGSIKNETLSQMTEKVKNIMKISRDRAITISRTEGNRAENYGRLDGAIQAPVKLKKWLSITNDNRTSPISKAMGAKYGSEEKAIELNDNFKVTVKGKVIEGLSPPFHPNERDVLMFAQQ